MNKSKLQQTAQSIAALLPYIVQGVHVEGLVNGSLTQTQFRLVVYLSLKGPCTMSTLASHMKVSMPTATGLIDRLLQGKYIKRRSHPHDRRQILIELTPKADIFLKKFGQIYAKRWEEILLILDEKEMDQMLGITNKLNIALGSSKS